MMTFEAYCTAKKIDHLTFKSSDANLFFELKHIFECVHPDSFTVQKKFLINKLRNSYVLVGEKLEKSGGSVVVKPKVLIPKINKPTAGGSKPVMLKPKMTSELSDSGEVKRPKAVVLKPKIPGQK